MATKETSQEARVKADEALMNWATMGMPSLLADTVCRALRSIATSGECRGGMDDWILFGEVVDSTGGPPLRIDVKRTSMLTVCRRLQNMRNGRPSSLFAQLCMSGWILPLVCGLVRW